MSAPREQRAAQTPRIADEKSPRPVASHRRVWTGAVFGLDEDAVTLHPGAAPVVRQYLAHPGAVGIVAVRGAEGREQILLVRQYRHPVRSLLWEIPAGLLDHPGERYLAAAQRELREETDQAAERWDVLVDYFTSPGGSSESIRIFLARDVGPVGSPFAREDEEAGMPHVWVDLDAVVDGVLQGRIHNPSTVVGALAASRARERQWRGLRPIAAPWLR